MHDTVTTGQATQIELWFPEAVTDVDLLLELAVDSRDREYAVTLESSGSSLDFLVARGQGWADSDKLGSSFAYLPSGRAGEAVELDGARLIAPTTSLRVNVVPWLRTATPEPVLRVWAHGRNASSAAYLALHGVVR